MTQRCPTCGQAVPEFGGIVADEERGEVRYAGKFTTLRAHEFALFRFLLEKKGRVASKQAILEHLYQLETDDEPEIKIIDVFVCKLRKQIEPLGIQID